jgi:DNA-binding Xre family transcriptional regulator
MAGRGISQIADLMPLLAQRGVTLSTQQVPRLVTHPPRRLSMDILAALCDILSCRPGDLIEIAAVREQVHKNTHGDRRASVPPPPRPPEVPMTTRWKRQSGIRDEWCRMLTTHRPGR